MTISGTRGFSLIEVSVTVAVIGVAIALAVPSWDSATQKRQLTSTSEQLAAFLAEAQSSAIKHNDELTVALVHNGATDWCIGAGLGNNACDCTVTDPANAAFCAIDGAPQVLDHARFETVEMASHSTDTTFTFDPIRGIMVSADLGTLHFFNLVSENDQFGLQINVLPTGRIRVCSIDSDRAVPGYPACPTSTQWGG